VVGLGNALEAVVDQLTDGVYLVDVDGRITYWSAGAERLLGYPAGEMVGRRCSDRFALHTDEDGAPLCGPDCPLARAIRTREAHSAFCRARHRSGRPVSIHLRIVPLADGNGRITGAVAIVSDAAFTEAASEMLKRLECAAMLDHLTQMPNRRQLETRIRASLAEAKQYGSSFGILLMDLDHFKIINDTYGHQAGDEALRMVAHTLRLAVRSGDLVGRWGGEEFMLVACGIRREGLLHAGERFRACVERSRGRAGLAPLQATVSIGGALARPDDSVETLVARADRALYQAKQTGRNCVVMDTCAPREAARDRKRPRASEAVSASAEIAAPHI